MVSMEWTVRWMGSKECDIQLVITFLKDKLNPYLMVLFGSLAKGTARADSDVDVAFLRHAQCSPYQIFMIGQELAQLLNKEVDLLDLEQSSTVMKAQIITSGRILYCSDDEKRMDFYIRALKEYALLNEERTPVLDELERRGSVYGK
ncbi:MAG: nucleotidyltransferase domain-containing protein [Veillonellales bacterium]